MAELLVCTHCDRGLECCYVCDREDCAETECSRCVALSLKERTPQPHGHGG